MTNESNKSSGITPTQELERGFICRTFFTRGGKKMSQSFVEAKALGVNSDWFTDPFAKVVWLSAEDLFTKDDFQSISLMSLAKNAKKVAARQQDDELKAVEVKLQDFEDIERFVRPTDDLSAYGKELQNALIIRNAREMMAKTAEDMASGEDPIQTISRLITSAQSALESRNPCHKLSISELCDRALSDWDEAYHQRTELGNYEWCPGIPLPWRKLSYALNGFTPDMTILAARPGVGKTSLAMNFARYWLDIGLKVVFVSVDMSPIGFVKRQLSERVRISSRKLQFGKSNYYPQERDKLIAEIKTLKELEKTGNFTLYGEYDVDLIKASCSILKDQGMIDVLIVDYLQLLRFKGSEKLSTTQKTTHISNTLHELANSLQIPVLCLSQLNRDTTKEGGREPQLSDLRDSGAIEQDAANVLLLHRNDTLYRKWKGEEPPIQFAKGRKASPSLASYRPIFLTVAKAREGNEGTKIPFVVVQNKYAWYLGDHEADGDAQFARVYDDWRHDDIEKVWAENGALIRMADIRAIERVNINAERTRLGLPKVEWKEDDEDNAITTPNTSNNTNEEDVLI